MDKTRKKFISWGLVIGILSLAMSILQFKDSGASGAEAKDWQENQSELLITLIQETRETRNEIVSLKKITTKQLESLGFSNSINSSLVAVLTKERNKVVKSKAEIPDKNIISNKVNAELTKIQSEEEPIKNPAIDKVGWIFIGKFDSSKSGWDSNYNKTISGFDNKNITEKTEKLEISLNVGFNDSKPEFPSYEKNLNRIYPYSLNLGTIVNVLKVADDVGFRNFTWAKVKVVSVPK